MEALNDDILIRIFGYLDIKSQQVMLTLHRRFYDLMPIVWSSEYKTVKMSLHEANFSIEHLNYFFESICKTVKVLHLRMMTAEQYLVLLRFIFPRVHDFRFATFPSKLLSDSDIPKLIETFPNLKTFSPQGNFSGRYFNDFPLLERLTLTYCNYFSAENLVNLMKVRKLKEIKLCVFDRKTIEKNPLNLPEDAVANLESIKLDFDELSWFEDHLGMLNGLRELNICGIGYTATLPVVCRRLGSLIQKHHFEILETCNTTESLSTVIGAKLRIDALKIVADNYLFEDYGYFQPSSFENIKQLFFKACCIQEKKYLDSLLQNCINVDLISFEQCLFIFHNYSFVASKITENRNKVLEINLYQNTSYSGKWNYTVVGHHELLHFIEGKNFEYTFEPIYMTFK